MPNGAAGKDGQSPGQDLPPLEANQHASTSSCGSFCRKKKNVAVKVLKSREGFAEAAQDELSLLKCVRIFPGSVLFSVEVATEFRLRYQFHCPFSFQVCLRSKVGEWKTMSDNSLSHLCLAMTPKRGTFSFLL